MCQVTSRQTSREKREKIERGEVHLIGITKYYCWYTANTLNISVFNALSLGSGLVAAVLL